MSQDKGKYKPSRASLRWRDGVMSKQKNVKPCPNCFCTTILSYKRKAKCTKCKNFRTDIKYTSGGEWQ